MARNNKEKLDTKKSNKPLYKKYSYDVLSYLSIGKSKVDSFGEVLKEEGLQSGQIVRNMPNNSTTNFVDLGRRR